MNRVLTLEQLRTAHCAPVHDQPPMQGPQIQDQLHTLPAWTHVHDSLQRDYKFANYYEAIAFVNAVAWIVHREDHHPELAVSYNKVGVSFSTHSVNGVSINDFICAAKFDQAYT
jgi:4a-hydroxytetrahydrobiopterin dehydratase